MHILDQINKYLCGEMPFVNSQLFPVLIDMSEILVQPEVSHTSIHCTWTEGNILPPELIEIIANKNASGVSEDD
jgi:hypothetical protein